MCTLHGAFVYFFMVSVCVHMVLITSTETFLSLIYWFSFSLWVGCCLSQPVRSQTELHIRAS